MDPQILILILGFFGLLLLNVPIAVCIGVATVFTLLSIGDVSTGYILTQRISRGIASFPLLAIPFFVLSGVLMGEGGMARRLMDFANAVMGRFHGGLAYVNTLTCMLFGAISGSSAAAVSSIGGFMIPEMERKNYGREFSVALTTTSATTGLLIPPSNIMIVYAVVAGNASVAALFVGGVLPGILMGGLIMLACFIMNRKQDVGSGDVTSDSLVKSLVLGFFRILPAVLLATGIFVGWLPSVWWMWTIVFLSASLSMIGTPLMLPYLHALPSLLLILIVIGGILLGWFTATEASAVAVAYALLLGVVLYREIKVKTLPELILKAAKTTSVVMLLVGASQAMSWVLAYEQIPQTVSDALLAVSENPLVILLIINVLLLVVGTFMDMTPAVLIFTPIFLPVVMGMGMHPVHFGILMITNLCIGLCTPPVGTCLFIGCSVGKTSIAKVVKPLIPIFVAMFIALLLITYVPPISMLLPNLLGL